MISTETHGACVLIVMGVSGAGKSSVAAAMNAQLHWSYQEGDELHPKANIEKMRAGVPLTDEDRAPWLLSVRRWIGQRLAAGESGIITCSALKRAYRDYLVAGRPSVRLLYLEVAPEVLRDRLARRVGHYMPASLLESQLLTLEAPTADEHPIIISADGTLDETMASALSALRTAELV